MRISLFIIIITSLFLTLGTAFAISTETSDSSQKFTSETSEKIITLVNGTGTGETVQQEGISAFWAGGGLPEKAQTTRIRADRSILTISSEKLSQSVLVLMAGKITELVPALDVEASKSGVESSANPKNWYSSFALSIVHEDTRFISLALDYDIYTGGAHGQHGRFGYVIDKKKKRFVRLNELFFEQRLIKKVGPEWKKQILSELWAEADIDWVNKGVVGSSNYRSFVITGSDIIVYGQSYQHNSYAQGERTLVYPLSKLTSLKKKYK